MFDHVTIRVGDREAGRRFYSTLLGPPSSAGAHYDEWRDFSLAQARDDHAVTRHLHVGFVARSRAEVDERWERARAAGYPSDGEPGPRPQYGPQYYGGFLLDPDGNSAEVVHNERKEDEGVIDHLWIGVSDLAATKRFYETVGPVLGLRIANELPERFHMAARGRSFGLVADGRPPTENLHLAFPAADDETVAEFHRVAVAAGYRDNGAPGERTDYHPGYCGAFVLDPDGTNVEAVNHNR